ncbi:polymorphic toxin-type HINT domain-containing protein [Streptomyces sp. NPDC006602]|uniref:polymorphic toxin-type HINT domain-containing protein n=1 Tax=Streptomyces sp. NPDC006602 TaxID=3364751 RepID=UPI00369A7BD6
MVQPQLAVRGVAGDQIGETVAVDVPGRGELHVGPADGADRRAKGTTTVTATAGPPFWVPSLGEWIDAGELKPGQWLQTSSGTWIQIGAVEAWTARKATVHNLTVTDAHTYYVLAGSAPVLAHNCDSVVLGIRKSSEPLAAQLRAGGDSAAHTFKRAGLRPHGFRRGPGVDERSDEQRAGLQCDPLHHARRDAGGQQRPSPHRQRVSHGRAPRPEVRNRSRAGFPGPNNGTAWEMSVVERQVRMGNRSWSSIQWYSGGRRIEGVVNPFS